MGRSGLFLPAMADKPEKSGSLAESGGNGCGQQPARVLSHRVLEKTGPGCSRCHERPDRSRGLPMSDSDLIFHRGDCLGLGAPDGGGRSPVERRIARDGSDGCSTGNIVRFIPDRHGKSSRLSQGTFR